jgi:MFS family permease
VSSLFNGFFKLFWATLLDYYPFKRIYGVLIWIEISCIVLINYAVYNKWAFMLVSCLTYMCDGSLTSMLPALVVKQFGMERGPQVYGYMYSVFAVSCMLGVFFVLTVKEDIGFKGMFIISATFSLTAALMNKILNDKIVFNWKYAYAQ